MTASVTLGQAIWVSVKPIIKIFLIIGTGYGLSKMNVLTAEATRTISDVILIVLLPCLAFNKIVDNIEDSDIKDVGIICLSSALIFVTGGFFAYLVRRFMPVPKKWYGGIIAGGIFPNISDLPIAYLQSMDTGLIFTEDEGDKGVANVIIFLAMFLLCVFNLGGFRLIEHDFNYNDAENATRPSEEEIPIENSNDSSSNSLDLEKRFTDPLASLPPPQPAKVSNQSITSRSNTLSPSNSFISSANAPSVRSDEDYERQMGVSSAITSVHPQPIAYTSGYDIAKKNTNNSSLSRISTYHSIDLRGGQAQGLHDIIKEYSNVDQFGNSRRNSIVSDDGSEVNVEKKSTRLTKMLTSDATVSKQDIKESGKSFLPENIQKFPLTSLLIFFLKNCLRPASIAVILSLTIAFIPWVKALFVVTSDGPNIKEAPDNEPALSFIMDFTSYVGAASVPFGLMLLGATLGKLKIGKLYPGFWKSAVVLVVLRQCVMPIFGVLWCDRLVKAGWCNWEDDRMLLFVIAINWGLPTMTTLIYFTASYTPEDCLEPVQMECVSFFLVLQYPLLVVSLPFLVTYFLKVQMNV
ncbi:hypothetical protein KAFR_0J01880 [Kazachstania africana CBS 2517]|uniref:Uncharacterized protein n=1 Tax=Kazachstania africana (strain ATCC 22294 / BCRC 22015 / CBS 2517 / CECT 1963 / NBRC 1671 / NRRL Y-8276) TaxID=1071382 RepID=H2B0V2_KAZAF|nr:hypothetical protein KAFR_0J01880 [Kazachstania africana CBS 2517]CCF60252.1 hypothetical protein KAFR_0J01880 [Kazachstania africana CBS 2517]